MKRYIKATIDTELTADNIMSLFRSDVDHNVVYDALHDSAYELAKSHIATLDNLVQKYNYSGWDRSPKLTTIFLGDNIATGQYSALNLYDHSSNTFGVIWNNWVNGFKSLGKYIDDHSGTFYFFDSGDEIVIVQDVGYRNADNKIAFLDKKTVMSLLSQIG